MPFFFSHVAFWRQGWGRDKKRKVCFTVYSLSFVTRSLLKKRGKKVLQVFTKGGKSSFFCFGIAEQKGNTENISFLTVIWYSLVSFSFNQKLERNTNLQKGKVTFDVGREKKWGKSRKVEWCVVVMILVNIMMMRWYLFSSPTFLIFLRRGKTKKRKQQLCDKEREAEYDILLFHTKYSPFTFPFDSMCIYFPMENKKTARG